jgi:hypothetical protein
MNTFLQRHRSSVIGVLSGFDRVRLRATARILANTDGLGGVLKYVGVLLKDFKQFAMDMSEQIKLASKQLAESLQRPLHYLGNPSISKEETARRIADEDKISEGLICVLSAVEPCWSFHVRRDRESKKLVLESAMRKCLHLYHYFQHPRLGFMHARLQSWLPFNVHVCLNGREWLARQMDQAEIAYRQRDNCFTWIQDVARAQELFDDQLQVNWAEMLNPVLHEVHPHHCSIFPSFPLDYYWSADESEWATDVMFKSAAQLAGVYPNLIGHAMANLRGRDVMRFLGRATPICAGEYGTFKGELVTDLKQRPEGIRIKHRVNQNSIKMYDKQGSVLRVETTINNTREFKVYRTCDGQRETTTRPAPKAKWRPMRKGVSDIHRRAQVCQAANERYLQAMADVADTTPLRNLSQPLCRRVKLAGRWIRGLNPLSEADANLLEKVGQGEFILNGFRNRNLRALLFPATTDKQQLRRQAGAVTRIIRMLRAHGPIRKVPKTHRYIVTERGRTTITALLSARQADTAKLIAAAA